MQVMFTEDFLRALKMSFSNSRHRFRHFRQANTLIMLRLVAASICIHEFTGPANQLKTVNKFIVNIGLAQVKCSSKWVSLGHDWNDKFSNRHTVLRSPFGPDLGSLSFSAFCFFLRLTNCVKLAGYFCDHKYLLLFVANYGREIRFSSIFIGIFHSVRKYRAIFDFMQIWRDLNTQYANHMQTAQKRLRRTVQNPRHN